MHDLTSASAAALLDDLKTRRVSAQTVMAATLDRIDAVNPQVNAIVGLRPRADVMAEAAAKDGTDISGPLHGLPIAVKDLTNVAGIVSTKGAPQFADFVPDQDDMLAARLRAAGAILIGKTNTPEFGLGSHTFNRVYGATKNPYDATKSCGGSSGGAAVALSTGMTALADGSDMMGSLRNPAAWNNVYGLRPTWGRVPSEPNGGNFLHQMSTLGPMARAPEDIAILLDVMSGPDPRQPHTAPAPPATPIAPANLTGLRIGWLGDWGGAFPMEPGILELCEEALRGMEGQGAQVEALPPPFDAEALWDSWTMLRSFQLGSELQWMDRDRMKDTAVWELDRFLALTAPELQRANVIMSEWFKIAYTLSTQYDALVLPSAQIWPFDVALDWPKEINGHVMDTYHRWMHVVVPVSLIGLPALAVPAGFGAQGLPMGMQFFAARGSDKRLLEIGAGYHALTQWPQKRPPQM